MVGWSRGRERSEDRTSEGNIKYILFKCGAFGKPPFVVHARMFPLLRLCSPDGCVCRMAMVLMFVPSSLLRFDGFGLSVSNVSGPGVEDVYAHWRAAMRPCGHSVDQGRVSYLVGSLFPVGVYIRYAEVLPNTRGFTGQVLHLVQFSSHLDK